MIQPSAASAWRLAPAHCCRLTGLHVPILARLLFRPLPYPRAGRRGPSTDLISPAWFGCGGGYRRPKVDRPGDRRQPARQPTLPLPLAVTQRTVTPTVTLSGGPLQLAPVHSALHSQSLIVPLPLSSQDGCLQAVGSRMSLRGISGSLTMRLEEELD
ncbi:hypothetical protein FOCC_FOCC000240 [Frankliniella occidentalis]|nr:hypothetical protein FOCC_FOCC000240 [Frankliniella occidentalis]